MYIPVVDILGSEFSTTGPQVAFLIPISLQVSVNRAHQGVTTNVELPVFIEQRFFDVLLNNVASFISVNKSVLNYVFDVFKFLTDLNAATSVRVFSWLYDP